MKYVLVLLVGIALGYFLQPKPQIVETKLTPEVSNKFQGLIDNEAKSFALQKDAEAKLKAAEELYGKMMLLLIGSLQLKSVHQYVPAEKAVIEVEKADSVVLPGYLLARRNHTIRHIFKKYIVSFAQLIGNS